MLTTPALVGAQTSVPFSDTVLFADTNQVASYVVALGSLPLRPELVVDAVPDAVTGGIQLQIELTDFQLQDIPGEDFCPAPADTIVSPPGSGPVQLAWKVWRCLPEIGDPVGDSVRVNVRVLSFGSSSAPASVHIAMRGVTTVPNSTMLLPYFPPGVPITVAIPTTRDTTIYERNTSGSNGAGQFLWAGRDVNAASPFTPYRVRSLVSFDLRTNYIPESATINSVELRLDVESILGTGNSLSVWSTGFDGKWDEGNADASGNEFQAGTSSTRAANWVNRGLPSNPDWDWLVPGGDPEDLLATQAITTTGVKVFTGTALRDAVDQMRFDFYNLSGFQDGFVLRGPESSPASSGVQIASRENSGAGANAPVLLVNLTQDAGEQIDIGQSGVVTYINEGQNLRWIYDLDHDDVYTSPIGGVCTVTGSTNSGAMPYSYRFTGTPGYTGHDCCTWQVDSLTTGTIGTGQLIFFHNLDASDPVNLPPDTDRDGIRDLCDNCALKANGPLLGSCLSGPKTGAPCRSNPECTTGACSLSQEDDNGDKIGNACVPEPGLSALLAAGLLGLCGFGRGRNSAGVDRREQRGRGLRSRLIHWAILLGLVTALPTLARAQVAVPFSTNVQFTNTSQVATYVVNLGTLPARPELVIDAIPTGASSNLEILIEISEVQISSFAGPESCPEFSGSPIRSAPSTGPAQLVWKIWVCDPPISGESGETARVSVRVNSFGSGGAPANVQIAMRGVTSPPAATQLMPYWTPGVQHTVTLAPSRDTTVYERDPAVSDGAGQFLWAGRDVDTASPFTPHAIRSLVVFPIRGGPIPTNATIDSVTLRLDVESIVGSGNQLQVWSAGFNPPWAEGIADAAGNEFQGSTSGPSAANWTYVTTGPDFQWGFGGSTGGDPFAVLSSQSVTTTGIKTFSSTALRSYVAGVLTNTSTLSFQDGFVLRGAETSSTSSGLQMASRENLSAGATKPELVVTFTLPAEPQASKPTTGSVYFIDEGQNLRWIYDLDQDDVYVTPVNGVCTVTRGEFDDDYFAPYSYAFNGAPSYTGHDCCTWHVDSLATGTVGTGQLIFFHNLDSSNPANLPPDTDRDGIRDLCDNCSLKANGPLLGSCLTGPRIGGPCRSNPECAGGLCSLSQEDADGNKTGDACVPEPGVAAMLAAGVLVLAGVGARGERRRHTSPSRLPAARSAAFATSRSGSLVSQRR